MQVKNAMFRAVLCKIGFFNSFLQKVHSFILFMDTLDSRLLQLFFFYSLTRSSEGRAQCSHGKDIIPSRFPWQAPTVGTGNAPRPLPGVAGTELYL